MRLCLRSAILGELRVQLWLEQGKISDALQWAQQHPITPGGELSLAQEVEQITAAWVQISCNPPGCETSDPQPEELLNQLDWLLETARKANRLSSVIKLLLLQAIALQQQEELDAALLKLGEALALAEPKDMCGYLLMRVQMWKKSCAGPGHGGLDPALLPA